MFYLTRSIPKSVIDILFFETSIRRLSQWVRWLKRRSQNFLFDFWEFGFKRTRDVGILFIFDLMNCTKIVRKLYFFFILCRKALIFLHHSFLKQFSDELQTFILSHLCSDFFDRMQTVSRLILRFCQMSR
jgi:hypothetical protein